MRFFGIRVFGVLEDGSGRLGLRSDGRRGMLGDWWLCCGTPHTEELRKWKFSSAITMSTGRCAC